MVRGIAGSGAWGSGEGKVCVRWLADRQSTREKERGSRTHRHLIQTESLWEHLSLEEKDEEPVKEIKAEAPCTVLFTNSKGREGLMERVGMGFRC